MNRAQRRRQRLERIEGGRLHPSKYTASELRQLIVSDAEARHGPASYANQKEGVLYLAWMTLALSRIAEKERKRVDDVFTELEAEVTAKTGHGFPL